MAPPPIRGKKEDTEPLDFAGLNKAIETATSTLKFLTTGIPIIKRGPKGELHVDVPIMYMDFALDRVHYDPQSKCPSPKGRPVRFRGTVDPREIRVAVEKALKEAYIVEAAEFRDPEKAWVIPVVWNRLIIMHIKVSQDGEEVIPDYGLTEEVRRHAT